jgi:DNA replicative helicase MCM subunit Mcm2 (Cdc46/Mcm family)
MALLGNDMDSAIALMQSIEARIGENVQAQQQAGAKNRLRMGDREREFNEIKEDFVKNIQEVNKTAETEFRHQLDLALLRMTEKKVLAEARCKELEQLLRERDLRIEQLEQMVNVGGIIRRPTQITQPRLGREISQAIS